MKSRELPGKSGELPGNLPIAVKFHSERTSGDAPKERRRGRAEQRLSKRVFLESPFLVCSLKVFRTFQVF